MVYITTTNMLLSTSKSSKCVGYGVPIKTGTCNYILQVLFVAFNIGCTFVLLLDCTASLQETKLGNVIAAASRIITHPKQAGTGRFHIYEILSEAGYDDELNK